MGKPTAGYMGYVVDDKPMQRPMLSGHCQSPANAPGDPEAAIRESHARCQRMRGGNIARPGKEFSPCPCWCHLGDDYECECGGIIRVALNMPTDEDGEPTYVHIDMEGNAMYGGCDE